MKLKGKIERKIPLKNWKVIIRDETRIVNELKCSGILDHRVLNQYNRSIQTSNKREKRESCGWQKS